MVIDLQKERFVRLIKKHGLPYLKQSLLEKDRDKDISPKEIEAQLTKFYDHAKALRENMAMEDIIDAIIYDLECWLEVDKGFGTKESTDIAHSLYPVLGELLKDEISREKSTEQAKVLKFKVK